MPVLRLGDLIEARGGLRIGVVGTYNGQDISVPLSCLGIQYHGEPLRELDSLEARTLLADILSTELAYSSMVMDRAEAVGWADRILTSLFPTDAKLFTNLDVLEPSKASSYGCSFSGTDATFSVGVIAVAPNAIGLVWVEDED
jgi:hypothetical protein